MGSLDDKFISSLQGGQQLFDLGRDPAESYNLAREQPERAAGAERLLARVVAKAVKDGARVQQRLTSSHHANRVSCPAAEW